MSKVPRGITARDFIKALHEDGFELKRTRGSHRIYRHPDGRRVCVTVHRLSDTFPIGTLLRNDQRCWLDRARSKKTSPFHRVKQFLKRQVLHEYYL